MPTPTRKIMREGGVIRFASPHGDYREVTTVDVYLPYMHMWRALERLLPDRHF